MSQINVNRIKDSNKGAPDFPSGVNVSGITSTVTLGVTNLTATNVNVSGVVTATTLDGSLLATGTPTLGLGVTINASGLNISGVATAGIVSATTLYGNGANITGIALTIAPLNYNPAVSGVDLGKSPGIGLTFNQAVKAGSGNVTLRQVGAAGTVVQTWGVGSSITYSNGDTISLSLVSDLAYDSVYHLSYPSGAFTNTGGDVSYVGTGYTFDTKTLQYQVWTWGHNNRGQLGFAEGTQYSSPVQLPGLLWSAVNTQAGGTLEHAGAIRNDGTLWAWGMNDHGALGLNNTTHYASPVQVPGTTWVGDPVISQFASQYRKSDGTLWVTGRNTYGELGQNNTTNYSSPRQVPGTDWASGRNKGLVSEVHMAAVKTDGTLWTWGRNNYGQLGQGQASDNARSSPVQVPGTTWNAVSGCRDGWNIATKTDGTMWGWGQNNTGMLGQNQGPGQNAGYSSPVQIPGTTWTTEFAAGRHTIAVKSDGTLWNWGTNYFGNLGLNSQNDSRSSPTQIYGGGTTWNQVMTQEYGVATATKTDGTLWTWGNNYYGNQGLNDETKRSSPTQVGTDTNWSILGRIHHLKEL
jgi:alpha-tubulin suppressor-like RCC1 family protein